MFHFSAAMCVYGGDNPAYFKDALDSILSQTLQADEFILVVDGPVPNVIDNIIVQFESRIPSMQIIRLRENKGHGIARNLALSSCKYDYVIFADADDINVKTRFEKQIQAFEADKELSVVSSSCFHFSDSINNVINKESVPISNEEIRKKMKTGCPICQPSVALKKSDVESVGGYQDWYLAEDYYLWLRLYLAGKKFANIAEPLVYIRTTKEQLNRRGGWKYFKSMYSIYQYMLKREIIDFGTYVFNVSSRFVVQVLLPNKVRAFIRKVLQ